MQGNGEGLAEFGGGEKTDISGLYEPGRLRPGAIEEFVYNSRLGIVLGLNLLRLAASLRQRDVMRGSVSGGGGTDS